LFIVPPQNLVTIHTLDGKNSTESEPQKNTQKHVFWGLTKNIEKHTRGWGGGGAWDLGGGKKSRESGETREPCQP